METLRNGFFTNGVFIKNGEGEVETNRLFRDSRVLAEFIEKLIIRYDDHLTI